MPNNDPICAHGIYLACCSTCRGRLELGLPLVRDCHHHDQYDIPFPKLWALDADVEALVKAAKALVACSEKIYAGSYRVSTDAIERLQAQIDRIEGK